MYTPGKYDWLVPFGISLSNLLIEQKASPDWNVRIFVELPIAFIACAGATYFYKAGLILQNREAEPVGDSDENERIRQAQEMARATGFIPVGGNVEATMPDMHSEDGYTAAFFDKLRNMVRTPKGIVTNQYTADAAYLPVPDLRWRDWATAIVNGQPMTQSRWTGRNKKFSKPEYSAQLNAWLKENKLTFENPKNKSDGFKPNRAEGWRYFNDLATGKEIVPLPHSQ